MLAVAVVRKTSIIYIWDAIFWEHLIIGQTMNTYSFSKPFRSVWSLVVYWCSSRVFEENILLFSYYLACVCLVHQEGKKLSLFSTKGKVDWTLAW